MQLKKGITIHTPLAGIAEQVAINNGTMRAGKATGLNYYRDSFIPKTTWRSLNSTEEKALISAEPFSEYGKHIFIGELPAGLKRSLITLGLHECTEMDQVVPRVKSREKQVKNISRRIDDLIRPFSSTGHYKFHRITRALPNWATTTRFFINDEFVFIGLHIDQSRPFTPFTAARSDNRISLNLGSETRYLALINLTLKQVVNMIKEKTGLPYSEINTANISTLFFKHFPGYPAIRLAIKPYQYYIAPTDNFLHDATTLYNTKLDVTFVYVGLFDSPQ